VRGKLHALLEKKAKIPGTNTTLNKTKLSKELCEIASRHHAIQTTALYLSAPGQPKTGGYWEQGEVGRPWPIDSVNKHTPHRNLTINRKSGRVFPI
jgi:hypothetical protein